MIVQPLNKDLVTPDGSRSCTSRPILIPHMTQDSSFVSNFVYERLMTAIPE